jgi:nitrogen fixation/metabolism regulation signal transduction histidine kinase
MLAALLVLVTAVVAVAATLAVSRRQGFAPTAPPLPAAPAPTPAEGSAFGPLLPSDIGRMIVDSAPTAIIVYRDSGVISYANAAARDLFFEGAPAAGSNLLTLLGRAPEPLRKALLGGRDDLFTVDQEGERETYHLAKRVFEVGDDPHTILLVKHLTQELNRAEVEIWKRLIRVISHELNNSLAPVSSLMHSARILVKGSADEEKLVRVFDTVGGRMDHLKMFLEGYARFARMPAPRRERVAWASFLEQIRTLHPEIRLGTPPGTPGHFDPAQMQQVLINLIKNAEEAGSARQDVALDVEETEEGFRVTVGDRGKGMSDEVLRSALLPFYSTKERGSGLGLPLCREIIEAHGGRLRIQSREGGGTLVTCMLPRTESRALTSRARLTLTRA